MTLKSTPWLTPEDVISRWTGEDVPDVADPLLVTLVGDALTLIKHRFPTLADRLAAGFDINLVKIVGAAVVQRAYNHEPTRKASYSYASGPFSESGSYAAGDGEAGLFLTEAEIALLRPPGVSSNAFSVNTDPSAGKGLYPYGWAYDSWGASVHSWRQ